MVKYIPGSVLCMRQVLLTMVPRNSRIAILSPSIPTMPGRSTSGFSRPGRRRGYSTKREAPWGIFGESYEGASCIPLLLWGTIVNRANILLVKTGKYIGFNLYHRSYLLWWSPRNIRKNRSPVRRAGFLYIDDSVELVDLFSLVWPLPSVC